jgi:predicted SnoaL-like aldol condensation-catalyzing enzyme
MDYKDRTRMLEEIRDGSLGILHVIITVNDAKIKGTNEDFYRVLDETRKTFDWAQAQLEYEKQKREDAPSDSD